MNSFHDSVKAIQVPDELAIAGFADLDIATSPVAVTMAQPVLETSRKLSNV